MRHRILSIAIVSLMFVSTSLHADEPQSENSQPQSEELQRVPLQYRGWAVIKRHKLQPEAPEDEWIAMRDLTMDDGGDIIQIVDEGKATGYSLQLIEITYEKTNTTVLKLGLIDDATGKTITYIWGEPGAGRLGMNLRWMQVGLTREATDESESG